MLQSELHKVFCDCCMYACGSGCIRCMQNHSGVNITPENERVKALNEACLDRSYLGFITNPKNGEVKALSVRVP